MYKSLPKQSELITLLDPVSFRGAFAVNGSPAIFGWLYVYLTA